MYDQWTCDKSIKTIQWGKQWSFKQRMQKQLAIHMQNNKIRHCLALYAKKKCQNSKCKTLSYKDLRIINS